MTESKHDCRVEIYAPGQRRIGMVSGCVLHLYRHRVSATVEFWFGQVAISTAFEDVANACQHFDAANLSFQVLTETHGARAVPVGFEVSEVDEIPEAILSLSGASQWEPRP